MKKIIFISFLLLANLTSAQEKMICKTATVTFEASVPAFEEVKATNNTVTLVLNPKTGEMAGLALMKAFRFKVALMEEHFNENYIESDRYPKAIFRGKIEDFDLQNLTSAPKDYRVSGKLELHGKTQSIQAVLKINQSNSGIKINSNFSVKASDFAIDIPAIVKNKVSNTIHIQLNAVLK